MAFFIVFLGLRPHVCLVKQKEYGQRVKAIGSLATELLSCKT
jgi:hypothetical protein